MPSLFLFVIPPSLLLPTEKLLDHKIINYKHKITTHKNVHYCSLYSSVYSTASSLSLISMVSCATTAHARNTPPCSEMWRQKTSPRMLGFSSIH
jgi:hypothetical protein